MTKKIDVQLYGHLGNNAVIKMPNRQNPGIVIQADTLQQLAKDAREIYDQLRNRTDMTETALDAEALAEQLEQMFEHLKAEANAIGEQIKP